MELRHYAQDNFEYNPNQTYKQDTNSVYTKPRGFWVSVKGDNDWAQWCESEQFHEDRLANEYEITLVENPNIYLIDNLDKFIEFQDRYGIAKHQESTVSNYKWDEISINWQTIANQYDGIIIAPYQWQARHTHDWYYTWDVASGCVWNLNAIDKIERVQ